MIHRASPPVDSNSILINSIVRDVIYLERGPPFQFLLNIVFPVHHRHISICQPTLSALLICSNCQDGVKKYSLQAIYRWTLAPVALTGKARSCHTTSISTRMLSVHGLSSFKLATRRWYDYLTPLCPKHSDNEFTSRYLYIGLFQRRPFQTQMPLTRHPTTVKPPRYIIIILRNQLYMTPLSNPNRHVLCMIPFVIRVLNVLLGTV